MGFAVEPRSQLSFEVTYLDMGWCKVKNHGWQFTNHTHTHTYTHTFLLLRKNMEALVGAHGSRTYRVVRFFLT